ncbi:MAG TPA: GGDEF domain-containing protein [Steroidobacteraceae bacterium]|nr:GGDEF domain-containing protein [Steroidobacteraceae bacterium]
MRRIRSLLGILLRTAFVLASFWGTAHAQVSCFISADPTIRNLQIMAPRDANATLPLVQAELDVVKASALPELDTNRMASLYAVQAHSYELLELDGDARNSAQTGLRLVPDVNNPIHVALLAAHAQNVYDRAGIDTAIKVVQDARARLEPDSAAEACLRITLGTLQYRQDRADLAIVNLMHAYQNGVAQQRIVQRMAAAIQLSKVMRDMGEYTHALALNAEVIEWNTAQKASLSLSVTRFLRGSILKEQRQFPAAIEEFTKARELSVQLDDTQGIAFADLDLCQVQIEIGGLSAARQRCENALRLFTIARSNDVVKHARAGLARIELEQGNAALALKTLNEILQNGAADMPPRDVAPLFKLRARANAALGNYRESYDDLDESLRRMVAAEEARRIRQAATLSARFETNRQLERNAELNRELGVAQSRQRAQKTWTAVAIGTGAIVITLMAFQLSAIRRHRRQLALLANQDSLTGLPNRRHTYELGKAALEKAAATGIPLTVAVIDLDHFKSINDRFGHAGGDKVLQEFARVCRESLRDSDVLGRWGGEEFLIVMPGATLDVALIALERLRELSLRIEIPSMGKGLQVGLSAGLAAYEANVKALDELIARADAALYKAKHEGRDLVRIADENYAAASSGVRRSLR